MAKTKVRFVDAPAKNDVYVGMLFVMNLAMLFGVALLALECTEYDWDSQPKGGPTINLPSVTRSAPAAGPDAGGFPAAPGDGGAAPIPPTPTAPPPAANEMGNAMPSLPTVAPPAALPIPPVVASTPNSAPAVQPVKPAPLKQDDSGPRPGFNPYFPR